MRILAALGVFLALLAVPANALEREARRMFVDAEMLRRAEVCEIGREGAALDPMAELLAWSFIEREAEVRQLKPLLPALASLDHLTTDQLSRLVDCLENWRAAARTEARIMERHPASEVAYDLARERRLEAHEIGRIIRRVQDAKVKAKDRAARAADDPDATSGENVGLSDRQIEAVRQQLASCWSPPVGARDEAMEIEIRIRLEPDGGVRSAELMSRERMGDAFYRAAAESALRAVRICSPLQGLPEEHYSSWKVLSLTLDPQRMLGEAR